MCRIGSLGMKDLLKFDIVKKKKKLKQFRDLLGFVQWFVNWTACNLTDRKELWGAIQNEKLLQAKGHRNKKVVLKEKSGLLLQGPVLGQRSSNHSGTRDQFPGR